MRSLILATMLLGCSSQLTIPAGRLPAYAAGEPVLTNEHVMVSSYDGGRLELLPIRDTCLQEVETAGRAHAVHLEAREHASRGCEHHPVSDVRGLTVGPTIEIVGAERTVIADARAVAGIKLSGAEMGSAPYAPTTGFRSGAALGVGIALLALGTVGGLGLFGAGAAYDPGPWDFTRLYMFGGGTIALGAGLGSGIPLIVYGGAQERVRAAEQPQVRFRASGIGLEWQ